MTSEEAYLKMLSLINSQRSIKNMDQFNGLMEEGLSEQELEQMLYDLHKGGRIKGIITHSNGFFIRDDMGITLNARGLEMLSSLQKKLETHNYFNNSTVGNIGPNYGVIQVRNENEANKLINEIIDKLQNSNFQEKNILITELQESSSSGNKNKITISLGKILSTGSNISGIGQLVIALLQYFNS